MRQLKIVLALSACCLMASRTIRAASPQDILASYDWSVNATPNLASKPPPRDFVAAFVASGSYLTPLQRLVPYQLCAFTFADLRHSGNLSLVASVDNSLRMLCNEVLIVDKDSSQLTVSAVSVTRGLAANDVKHLIKDLKGNGDLELVVDSDITGYAGAGHCVATWPVIYAWSGSEYADVSNQFTNFYKDELNRLNKQIAVLPPASGESPVPYSPAWNADCLKAEAAKIQRVLDISPNAGLSQAESLARSADADTRDFALELLEDIGTAEARAQIGTLAGSSVKRTADVAQSILAERQQRGYQNAPPQPEQLKSVPFTTTSK